MMKWSKIDILDLIIMVVGSTLGTIMFLGLDFIFDLLPNIGNFNFLLCSMINGIAAAVTLRFIVWKLAY